MCGPSVVAPNMPGVYIFQKKNPPRGLEMVLTNWGRKIKTGYLKASLFILFDSFYTKNHLFSLKFIYFPPNQRKNPNKKFALCATIFILSEEKNDFLKGGREWFFRKIFTPEICPKMLCTVNCAVHWKGKSSLTQSYNSFFKVMVVYGVLLSMFPHSNFYLKIWNFLSLTIWHDNIQN